MDTAGPTRAHSVYLDRYYWLRWGFVRRRRRPAIAAIMMAKPNTGADDALVVLQLAARGDSAAAGGVAGAVSDAVPPLGAGSRASFAAPPDAPIAPLPLVADDELVPQPVTQRS